MNELIDLTLMSTTFFTLFVIMDPPGTVPVFLALTSTMTARQRRTAARQATVVAFGVILVFTLFGQYILNFLHISVPALQLSGGLLLLLVAMELLTGKSEEPRPSGSGVNVALVPLGTPLLAGPGAIVAAMLAVEESDRSVPAWTAIAVALVAIHVVLWLSMRFAGVIHRVLGDGGTTLVTRLAGLLLAAIAVQLMADAVFAFIDQRF
ncbi:MarC family protein [Georgenia sp. EYE_87]|uniref:MarC family protein n=1 Tax=Georgenia sp. EYE_87 TaxID=2853448 RepID=UPI00200608A4|nr:MarC family protein [Georgenia sp. EYE_87]MCK6210032.1 MarC family protein [Georgenia sp. EYE_87]